MSIPDYAHSCREIPWTRILVPATLFVLAGLAPPLPAAPLPAVPLPAGPLPAAPRPSQLDPQAVSWSSLEFRASKLFLTATAEVSLEHLPASVAGDRLRSSPQTDDRVPAGPVGHMIVTSKLGGRQSAEEVFFALADGETFERRKRKLGRKPYARSERYAHSGVHGERRSPASDREARLEAERWSQVDLRFDAYAPSGGKRALTHPLVLFYLVSSAPLEAPGDRLSVDAHASRRFVPIDLEVAEVVELDVSFQEQRGGVTRERRESIEALRIEVRDASGGDADLGFLGLESGIEIFVERGSRLPVLVRGSLGALGRLEIRLVSAQRR